jgi:DNA invertase Pin-like site-specific DNA recombinase
VLVTSSITNAFRRHCGIEIMSRASALIQSLEDAGVRIFAHLDNKEVTVDGDSMEVDALIHSWASQERKNASQRVRDALKRRAETGKSTGSWPYGYRAGGKGHPKRGRDHHPHLQAPGNQ